MGNNWVYKASEEGGIYEISDELGSFGDWAAGDSCGGYGESPLVKEIAVVEWGGRDGFEAEEVVADEAVWRGAESEGEAEEVVEEAAGGGVEDVGEHDVHGVFGADGAGAEHGEAELHGEDEVGGEEEVGSVDGVVGVYEFVGDGGELVAEVGGGGGGVGGVGAKELGQVSRAVRWRERHGWTDDLRRLRERERERDGVGVREGLESLNRGKKSQEE